MPYSSTDSSRSRNDHQVGVVAGADQRVGQHEVHNRRVRRSALDLQQGVGLLHHRGIAGLAEELVGRNRRLTGGAGLRVQIGAGQGLGGGVFVRVGGAG